MEQEELHNKLDFYVQAFERARQKVGDDAAAAAIVEQVGKDFRTALLMADRNGRQRTSERRGSTGSGFGNGDQAATPAQMGYLRSLGVSEIPAGLTKAQASRMIDEALEA